MNRKVLTSIKIIEFLISAALAVLVVYFAYSNFYLKIDSVLIAILLIIGGFVSALITETMHELGHLIFGKFCKFSFNKINISFIKIYKKDGKTKITFKKLPQSVAGSTEMIPQTACNLKNRFLYTISGGLIFSFLTFLAFLLCFIFSSKINFFVYIFTAAGLPYAFHLFIYNFLPLHLEGAHTDGALVWGIILKDDSYITALNILAIEGLMHEGRSPSEIDENLYFSLPQLQEDDLNFILLTSYRLMYYLDSGDIENAIRTCDRLEELAEYVPDFYYNDILSEIMFCECCLKGDDELCKELFKGLEFYLKREDTISSHRILAAYELYINQDKKISLNHINEARKKAKESSILGLVKYECKLVDCIYEDLSK